MQRRVPEQLRILIAKYQETKDKKILESCIVLLYKMLCNIIKKKADLLQKYDYEELFGMGYTALVETIKEWDLDEDINLIGVKINQKIDAQLKDQPTDDLVVKQDYRYRGKDIREDMLRALQDMDTSVVVELLKGTTSSKTEQTIKKISEDVLREIRRRLRPLIRLYGLQYPRPRVWWRRMTVGY